MQKPLLKLRKRFLRKQYFSDFRLSLLAIIVFAVRSSTVYTKRHAENSACLLTQVQIIWLPGHSYNVEVAHSSGGSSESAIRV